MIMHNVCQLEMKFDASHPNFKSVSLGKMET
jgi:hypothetical protein